MMGILRRWPKSYDATSRLNFGFCWKQRVLNYFIWRELQSYIITQIDLSPALFFFETAQCTYFIYYQWWYKNKKNRKELWLCKLKGLSWTNHSIKETDFIAILTHRMVLSHQSQGSYFFFFANNKANLVKFKCLI